MGRGRPRKLGIVVSGRREELNSSHGLVRRANLMSVEGLSNRVVAPG